MKGGVESDSGGNGQNKGLIVGLVAAGVIVLGCVVVTAVVLFRRRSRKGNDRGYVKTGETFAPGGMYDSEKYEFPSENLRIPYDPPSGSH